MPNHDRFECQTAIDSDAILQFIYWGPSGMVAGEAIIISITGGFLFGLLMASFHWWRRKVNRLPSWDDV
ncbi:hypothetical protein GTT76_004572 [Salmonella enterica]|nr:hypothetical protein [Salmonella enterica subsp. enterica serovar Newport]EDW3705650.1 hypothetical protein [Salmonella enterica subsp. enterica serovar Newport]